MSRNDFVGRIATRYDTENAAWFSPTILNPAVALLAELADEGDALEFGIGTGRVAVPLAAKGVRVHGIELSTDMVDVLRAKEGASRIDVTIGDFATTRLNRSFGLVYLVFNTITNLTSQDEQVECFCNAAEHLHPGGSFVIECYIPHLRRLPPGETIHPFDITSTHLGFEEYDFATQIAFSHHYSLLDGDFTVSSAPYRYVWPSELDLMARIAGLTLRDRWGSWRRDPFTGDSTSHVSVWTKDPSPGSSRT